MDHYANSLTIVARRPSDAQEGSEPFGADLLEIPKRDEDGTGGSDLGTGPYTAGFGEHHLGSGDTIPNY